jgi:hypothetical protein
MLISSEKYIKKNEQCCSVMLLDKQTLGVDRVVVGNAKCYALKFCGLNDKMTKARGH